MSIYYGSSGDVREDLGNPTETEVTADLIELSRKKATSIVDGMLEAVYPAIVPWSTSTSVPALINSITDDLSVYFVKRSRHPGPMPLSEDVRAEYWDRPMELLQKIHDRELELPELTSSLGDKIEANREDYTPIFDVDNIESAIIDDDLLDDVADARA